MKRNLSKTICLGGILSAIAIFTQSAPVFLPQIGLFLSPLSTLPMAIAAKLLRRYGILSYLCAAFILFFISSQESMIFLVTTGLLGVVLGLLIHKRMSIVILISGVFLFFGICILIFIIGIPAFGDFLIDKSLLIRLSIYGVFSFFYTSLWSIAFRKTLRILDNALLSHF